jgi:uncharacterized membrane protein
VKDVTALPTPSVRWDRNWFSVAWKTAPWIFLLGLIVHYVLRDALHYLFQYTPQSFKEFWSERLVIRTHVAVALVMVLVGPLQFWTGFRMRYRTLHRWSGRIFLITGTVASSAVLYMGLHPRLGGVVYGFGLFLNGLFWLAAAAMAYYAIRIGNVQVHKEWMIRTYVLTCAGFVGARVVADMDFLGRLIGTTALNDLSSWVNWALPLMVTEIVLQIRRLGKTARLSS